MRGGQPVAIRSVAASCFPQITKAASINRRPTPPKGKHVHTDALPMLRLGAACIMTRSTEDYEKLYLLKIPTFLPEPFRRSVQWHFEMSFRSIPHHFCERERGVLCPRDSIFACFESSAKVSNKSVRSIL